MAHEAASNVNEVTTLVEGQEAQFARLRGPRPCDVGANQQNRQRHHQRAGAARGDLENSRQAIGAAVDRVATLVEAAARIEKRLQDNIGGSLAEVAAVPERSRRSLVPAAAPPRPRRQALC